MTRIGDGSSTEIRELLDQIDDTPSGPEERALIEKALAMCIEISDEVLEYEVRMRLTVSAALNGDNDAQLFSFAWCLAKHDEDPQRFPRVVSVDGPDLMWQFKWIASTLTASPIFPLSQCEAALDDMEAHYSHENLGLSGVHMARLQHSIAVGDLDQAQQMAALLASTTRDDYSHCEACSRSVLAILAVNLGDEAQAISLVDEIMAQNLHCGDEPERALATVLVPLLRAGRTSDALAAHARSYRRARTNPDKISIVSDNLVFCAITGNQARGLAMAERHLRWVAHDNLNARGQLSMLVSMGLVFESVVRAGFGQQVVRGADAGNLVRFFGVHEGPWTVSDLVNATWRAAEDLTLRFDARNQNTHVSDRVAKAKALLDEPYDLQVSDPL